MPALDRPLERLCLRLWKDDVDKLRQVAATVGDGSFNMLARSIIHDYVMRLNDRERVAIDRLNLTPTDLLRAAEGEGE